ncbi:MAG TPA: BTAD domain-containing putative transcriptional regulator [Actinophytocola sp.]|nr:BTAD domain-containing putative transcriptional regulator [Actinophytocola sp.]
MAWRFRLLGDLEVSRHGERCALTATKVRVLLVTLLLNDNRVVPFAQLESALWPSRPPASARNALHTYVARLRHALGSDAGIRTRSSGYTIDVDPGSVDVNEFRTLVADARTEAHSGDGCAEHALLTTALALWRGPAFADIPAESLPEGLAEQLEEQRLDTVERRAFLDVEGGRHNQAVAALLPVTRTHPLRENAWWTLMLALNRAGRVAEALDTYREVRHVFRDELGLEPNERIQRLYQAILAADRVAERTPEPPAEKAPVVPRQLPNVPGGFAGRAAEVAALTERLSHPTARLLVVSGPPGVGKTALTLTVAHQVRSSYPDGQLYANLQGYSLDAPLPPQVVLARFLRALGIPPAQTPADLEDQACLFRSLLADRRLLIVLDNASGAGQVRPLLPGSAGSAVIVTSRDDLRGLTVDGARHTRVNPLDEQASWAVLADLLGPEPVEREPAAVRDLIAVCAGLPLALRIAGANLAANPHLRLAGYLDDLRSPGRLDHLTLPGDGQVAVRAAFDLSYVRLPAPAARQFRLLGVMPGPEFSVRAVAALIDADPVAARRALDDLVAANLVVPTGPERYQLHDLIREYAAVKAGEHADVADAVERLWDFYLDNAHTATNLLYTGRSRLPAPPATRHRIAFADAAAGLDWLEAERANLVAAVQTAADHGVPAHAGRLVDAMRGYLWLRGNPAEILAVCAVAETAAAAVGDQRAEASVVDLMGLTYFSMSRFDRAAEHHMRALAISRACDDATGQADSLHNIGRDRAQTGPPEVARKYYHQAFAIAVRTGDVDAQARNVNYIGASYQFGGEFERARDWHLRAMRLSRRTGNLAIVNSALGNLGNVERALGNLRGAVALYEENVELSVRLGNLAVEAVSRIALAKALCDTGDHDRALDEAERGTELGVRVGERRHEICGIEVATTARFRAGRTAGVEESYRDALRVAREISFVHGEVSTAIALAAVYRYRGDPATAVALVEEAVERMREVGLRDLEAHAFVQLGHAHRERGEYDRAAELAHAALRAARARGARLVEARALYLAGLLEPAEPYARAAHELVRQVGAATPDIVPAR